MNWVWGEGDVGIGGISEGRLGWRVFGRLGSAGKYSLYPAYCDCLVWSFARLLVLLARVAA